MTLVNLNREIVQTGKVVYPQELSKNAIVELQQVLKTAGYYKGKVDGIYGIKTLNAVINFKTDAYQSRPKVIGAGTVKLLEGLKDKADISEQRGDGKQPTVNKQAGTHTGKSVILPGGTRVHANELILPSIPLTWGEMTKNLTRVPHSIEVVRNIIEVTIEFGKIRNKINQPLKINSGYRPPHLKIGSNRSLHKVGSAIDVRTLNLKDIYLLWNVMAQSSFVGLGRGMKRGFVHGDLRKTGQRRVVFNYY